MVDQKTVESVDEQRGIVYQKYSLFPHISVLNNVTFGPILHKTNLPQRVFHTPKYFQVKKEAQIEAQKLILDMGLTKSDLNKFPQELSGGMQQRVAIAQSLMMKPKVLLMDEPFGALDPNTRNEMQLLLLEWSEKHKITIIFVTHDLEEACFLGTRVVCLSQHWTDDSGNPGIGAKIVLDEKIRDTQPKPTSYRKSKEFLDRLDRVRKAGQEPENIQHQNEFDLTYESSRTLIQNELTPEVRNDKK